MNCKIGLPGLTFLPENRFPLSRWKRSRWSKCLPKMSIWRNSAKIWPTTIPSFSKTWKYSKRRSSTTSIPQSARSKPTTNRKRLGWSESSSSYRPNQSPSRSPLPPGKNKSTAYSRFWMTTRTKWQNWALPFPKDSEKPMCSCSHCPGKPSTGLSSRIPALAAKTYTMNTRA